MNRRVYIAGPISNAHSAKPREIYKNVKKAQEYYDELIHAGWTPYLPHLSYYAWLDMKNDVHWPRWIELDLDYIDSCIALIRIPGDSKGADMEIEYAKEKEINILHVLDPVDAVNQLKIKFGEPKTRPEINKYLNMIKETKEGEC